MLALAISLFLVATTTSAMADPLPCADPRVLVLFDSSGSLGSKANAGSNYNAAVSAVLSMTAAEGDHLEFGLLVFPAPPAAKNCETTTTLAVPFALDAQAAFEQFFDGFAGPTAYSDTPMLQVLNGVANAKPSASGLGALKQDGTPGYVILVTDGSQDCCYDEHFGTGSGWDAEVDCNWGTAYGAPDYWNAAEFAENRADLIQMVQNIHGQGIPVFVVGFGSKVDPEALDGMAKAGGTERVAGCGVGAAVGPCYYQADNSAELSLALSTVAKKVGEEQCNGADDDCDGDTDEGLSQACKTACGEGVQVCDGGDWGKCSAPEPMPEECNGSDDDCDGKTDEDLVQECFTACGKGTEDCYMGAWGPCSSEPQPEECNAIDDDCDGSTDEGCDCLDGKVEPCGSGDGECKKGERTCTGGKWGDCAGGKGPQPETCNDKDDDCDSVTDGMVRECTTACGTGKEKCVAGAWVDCTAKKPVAESCNDQDDDCDGAVDEGVKRECETACGKGEEKCVKGGWVDCTAKQPTQEVCDGADNDCNGVTDDEDSTALPCQVDCGKGMRKCLGGVMGPCEVKEPAPEQCDGLDNDCDGQVDDGAVCPGGGKCVCSACAAPVKPDGTCDAGVPVDGWCVIDKCGPGKWCKDGECVDGFPPETEDDIGTSSEGGDAGWDPGIGGLPEKGKVSGGGGCGCRTEGGGEGEESWWFVVALMALSLGVAVRWRFAG